LAHHLNVVLTEGMVNAIKHANAADPNKDVLIHISASDLEICIKVYDSGQGFDLATVPEPNFETDQLGEKGRGIFIIRSLMDSVEYKKTNGGNVLEMKKKLG
jgi:serine/threonine-protein kinase RsbW